MKQKSHNLLSGKKRWWLQAAVDNFECERDSDASSHIALLHKLNSSEECKFWHFNCTATNLRKDQTTEKKKHKPQE